MIDKDKLSRKSLEKIMINDIKGFRKICVNWGYLPPKIKGFSNEIGRVQRI